MRGAAVLLLLMLQRNVRSMATIVDRLLAVPKIHPRDIDMSIEARAGFRHAFQRSVFEAAFPGARPRIVSVAGTKGKGSVSELLRAALAGNGTNVGCFTSPHLHDCRERIRVGATPLGAEALEACGAEALQRADDLNCEAWGAVFFDRLLAAANLYFGSQGCEVLVLEAGVGGLYDSTNFFDEEELACCVITSISRDHTELLGETLEEIAANKAGVMRRGAPAFTPSTQPPAALATLKAEARRLGADLRVVDCAPAPDAPGPATFRENERLAAAACAELGVAADFGGAHWPARFERIEAAGRTLLVDAAHNGDSVLKLLDDAAATYPEVPRWIVAFGCGAEKEGKDDMVAALRARPGVVERVLCVEAHFGGKSLPPSKRPAPAGDLAAAIGAAAEVADPPSTYAALDAAPPGSAVLVCGSVYVAAEAREWAADRDPDSLPADDWARTLRN